MSNFLFGDRILCFCLFFCFFAAAAPPSPQWAMAFNATTVKIRPGAGADPHWGKIWYDWKKLAQLQTFYTQYFGYPESLGWGEPCCSILFADEKIFFLWPDGSCDLDHDGIPPVSPNWLQGAVYQGMAQIRGVPTTEWYLPLPSNVSYWNRIDNPYIPVRSSNQVNDPGATDYMDVLFGPQDASLFTIPSACANARPPTKSCPPWDTKK